MEIHPVIRYYSLTIFVIIKINPLENDLQTLGDVVFENKNQNMKPMKR